MIQFDYSTFIYISWVETFFLKLILFYAFLVCIHLLYLFLNVLVD